MYSYNKTLPNWLKISIWSNFLTAKTERLLPTLKITDGLGPKLGKISNGAL